MVEGVNAAGGNAKLTTFDEGKHSIGMEVYNNYELYDWLLQHIKDKMNGRNPFLIQVGFFPL
jgi:hypothetical protein